MSLLPFLKNDINEVQSTTIYKEYEFEFNNNRLTGKLLEGKAAIKMWIHKALLTKRYIYPIYSWDYGQDLEELIGQGYEHDFIKSEVERRIQDCLMVNEKITKCHSFEVDLINEQLQISFTAETKFGKVVINV